METMTRTLATSLMVTTILAGATGYAFGQPTPDTTGTTTGHPAARPARAAPSRPAAADAEQVSVVGSGSTRQVQTISTSQISRSVPGTSPYKIMNQMPGVAFTSADPLGIDTWSQSIYMHGFSQDQLGFTLDGMPLGAQTYRAYNGLNVNNAISPENIKRLSVSQGAGSLDVASSSNLGGTVQFYSLDPSDHFGGKVAQTFGSNATFRTFGRIDSGQLNPSGTKFYVSYARTSDDKWKGHAGQFQQQVNAKFVQPIGESTKLTGFFDWSDMAEASYAVESLETIHKLGTRVDYYYPDYTTAYRAAQGIYSHGEQLTRSPRDVAYYDDPALSQDYFGGLTLDTKLNSAMDWKTTIYGHGDSLDTHWTNPHITSPNGAPLAEQVRRSGFQRYGLTSGYTWRWQKNTFNTGLWYENDHYTMGQYYYQEPILGQGNPIDPFGALPQPFAQAWGNVFNTNTFQYYLQDTYKILPNLTVHAGFRSLLVTARSGVTENNQKYTGVANLPAGSLTASNAFLPQVSANWRFLPHNELYFDVSKNMRAYPQAGYSLGSPWSVTTMASFQNAKKNLKPEEDWVYELGYRLTMHRAVGLISLYHTDFSNRLQTITSGASIIQNQSTMQNVGGVHIWGVDGSLTLNPIDGMSLYNSISYSRQRFDSNLTTGGVTYNLSGKNIPNYPDLMYKSSLSYSYGPVMAHIDANYMSRRYLSYMNDTHVPGYWQTNLGVRVRGGDHGPLHNITVDFNIYNLTNTTYISTVGVQGNPIAGDYQSMLIGAPRQFFGTVSANF
ncbi:TonB-dependent receptor [Gluconacetobacter tumulicola]